MTDTSAFHKLFEKAAIGNVTLKNRVVMLPQGTAFAAPSGEVTDRTMAYYAERAKGGVGTITVGNVSPHYPCQLNQLALNSDAMMMGHYELVEKVHSYGAKIMPQLNAMGRLTNPAMLPAGEYLISSSNLPAAQFGQVLSTPRPLRKDEIYQWIDRYVSAARRAKQVGYDMVELHAAHGYLANQFLSPFINNRTDEFGGTFENRMRFVLELIGAVRHAVGSDFPVGIRISADEFVPGGVTLEESRKIARLLEAAGVAYISVSAGISESMDRIVDPMAQTKLWREEMWAAIKQAVNVPIIAGGNLRDPAVCERLLAEGKLDFVGLARPFTADPEWPKKVREGRLEDIRTCLSCNECIIGSARRRFGGGARRCTVNAAMGREREFVQLIPAPQAKEVLVIGGGPGGMEAARIAALRGHRVTLCDKAGELGGQILLAAAPQSKKKLLSLRDYLQRQLEQTGVTIKLGVEVHADSVLEARPDAVVLATGAAPVMAEFPCDGKAKVLNAWDVLSGNDVPEQARVAIIGAGMVGSEVAEYLTERGNRVTLIGRSRPVAHDLEPINRGRLLMHFKDNDVVMLTGRQVVRITTEGVHLLNTQTNDSEFVGADCVVVATGSRPVSDLASALEGKVPELYSVGDCNRPRIILEAIYEGALVGRQI